MLQHSQSGESRLRRSQLGNGVTLAAPVGRTMVAGEDIDTLLAVMQGVRDVEAGHIVDLGSFAQYAEGEHVNG